MSDTDEAKVVKFKPIAPFEIVDRYNFNFTVDNDPNKIVKTFLLLKSCPSIRKCIRFLKYNRECIAHFLYMTPISIVIDMWSEYFFLKNWWSSDVIKRLEYANKLKTDNDIFNMKDSKMISDNLINISTSISTEFNFANNFIKRYHRLKNLIDIIDIDDYWLSSETIYLIGHIKTDIESITVVLYPKTLKIKFSTSNWKIYNSSEIVCIQEKMKIIIYKTCIENPLALMYNHKETAIFDKDILCLLGFYQRLKIFSPIKQKFSLGKEYTYSSIKVTTISKIRRRDGTTRCYVCKNLFDTNIILDTYDSLCLDCAYYNYSRKTLFADLVGKTALVTGIRHKIGFEIALKLLRCGCYVIGTTRFPGITWYNYTKEDDFESFKDRLFVFKCDFLRMSEISNLIEFCKTKDICIIINNACQTIRMSDYEYQKTLEWESITRTPICSSEKLAIVTGNVKQLTLATCSKEYGIIASPNWTIASIDKIDTGLKDAGIEISMFRTIKQPKYESSWTKKTGEIDEGEIVEATLINQMAPTLIVNGLKNYMASGNKFILFVVALEGQFECKKNDKHPHTNMCKAALNMFARTLAEDPDKNLHIYSVDPGFVSGVNPTLNSYPLTAADGAARVLDPIMQFLNDNPFPKNITKLRNYEPVNW